MPPAIGERFREMTGRTMHEIYGMTEASGLIAIDAVASGGGEGAVASALPKAEVGDPPTRAVEHHIDDDEDAETNRIGEKSARTCET